MANAISTRVIDLLPNDFFEVEGPDPFVYAVEYIDTVDGFSVLYAEITQTGALVAFPPTINGRVDFLFR